MLDSILQKIDGEKKSRETRVSASLKEYTNAKASFVAAMKSLQAEQKNLANKVAAVEAEKQVVAAAQVKKAQAQEAKKAAQTMYNKAHADHVKYLKSHAEEKQLIKKIRDMLDALLAVRSNKLSKTVCLHVIVTVC